MGLIPQNELSIIYVDSEEIDAIEKGYAINAIDGNPNTYWHTQWLKLKPSHPHEIQIDLGQIYNVGGFRYLPRQDGLINGRIKNFEFYVSNDINNWEEPVAIGELLNDIIEQEVTFTKKKGKYIKLVALNEFRVDGLVTCIAELNFLGDILLDPCEGMTCPDYCDGTTLYHNGTCVDGECVYNIEENSLSCEHVPHEIQLDLGQVYDVGGFRYLPRQDGLINGRIKNFEFYVSNDINNWEEPVAIGELLNDIIEQEVTFTKKKGKYIKLVALNEFRVDGKIACVAELNVLHVAAIDPCEGIECPDFCDGTTRYFNGVCVDGECTYDVEEKSVDCGYVPPDPCEGIVCDNVCVDYDLYSQKCVDGICESDQLIEQNSSSCGYAVPNIELVNFEFRNDENEVITTALVGEIVHGNITVKNTGISAQAWIYLGYLGSSGSTNVILNKQVTLGKDESVTYDTSTWVTPNSNVSVAISLQHMENGNWIQDVFVYRTLGYTDPCEGKICPDYCDYETYTKYYNGVCVDGECVYDTEENSVECGYDPCEGMICDNICIDFNLWSQKCVNGICTQDEIIEYNSKLCEYTPPDEPSAIAAIAKISVGLAVLKLLMGK